MKRWLCLILALFLLGTAAACTADEPAEDKKEPETSETVPPLLNVNLETLLTPEQIGDAIGAAVGKPQMYEDDTWAHYTGTDSAATVDISMDQTTRAVFDARAELYESRTEAPFLGEVSWWNRETGELLTYGGGYTISVRVGFADPTADEDMQLMATRHLTALLIEKIAA